RDNNEGRGSIWVMPMLGGNPVEVSADSADDSHPCWLPDGQRIVYCSERAGIYQLCTAYLNGTRPQQVTFGDSSYFPTDVSANGSRILYTTVNDLSNIWRVGTDLGPESEVTSGFGVEFWPQVSPNGTFLAFQDTGKPHVQRGPVHSTIITKPLVEPFPETQSIPPVADGFDPMWLPDGSGLSFL